MSAQDKHFARNRSGFAAIFSISLIILVGATLAIMGSYFAAEAKRSAAQQSEAQLRQLVIAGGAVALERAEKPAHTDEVALPPALKADGASLTVHVSGEGDQRGATIVATIGPRRLEQTLQLNRSGERWHVR
jgi:hypothetical protein